MIAMYFPRQTSLHYEGKKTHKYTQTELAGNTSSLADGNTGASLGRLALLTD